MNSVAVIEKTEYSGSATEAPGPRVPARRSYFVLAVALIAAAIFLGSIASPPALMDDVDAVHGQIARNMLTSGDWTIAHLDGVPYIEKAPLLYWLMAFSYRALGVHDWVARIPVALAAVLLCWLVACYGQWAFHRRAGFYAGLSLATCVGLFLFTRIQIPDVILTLCMCAAMWSFQRALDLEEPHPRLWAGFLAASIGVGILTKGLIGLVLPVGSFLVYLVITRQLFSRNVWRRLHLLTGTLIILAIAAPWHILATRRLPPYFDFTLHSGPGQYHGFFWFYFINEQLLRFLGLRYPHDYNTVPRPAFWLLHLLWLFPWSFYFPAVARLSFRPDDRSGQTRLLALSWIGFVLVFFTLSTTQEYYSMPVYPAMALLLGCAMAGESRWIGLGSKALALICAVCTLGAASILWVVRGMATQGDISSVLSSHPDAYTLSLGHLGDLTIRSFAYLRTPLALAGLAFLLGALGAWRFSPRKAFLAIALMMVVFLNASRLALAVFDPYLSSRSLAQALSLAPPGQLVVNGAYYPFSSVFFYTNRTALLLNGRFNNLEYGSYAPGAAQVFITDAELLSLWSSGTHLYLLTDGTGLLQVRSLLAPNHLYSVAESGGKFLFSNIPLGDGKDIAAKGRPTP